MVSTTSRTSSAARSIEHVGKQEAHRPDEVCRRDKPAPTAARAPSSTPPPTPSIKRICLENGLHLLDAQVRHLGTDINYVVLENLYDELKDKVDFHFEHRRHAACRRSTAATRSRPDGRAYTCNDCIVSVGRSGSKWMESVCRELDIPTKSNRVDIGVRVELPADDVLPPDRRAL